MLRKILKISVKIILVLVAIAILYWLGDKFYMSTIKPPADFLYMTDKIGEHSIGAYNISDLADDCSINEDGQYSPPSTVTLDKITIKQSLPDKQVDTNSFGLVQFSDFYQKTCPELDKVNFYIYNHKTGLSKQISLQRAKELYISYQYHKNNNAPYTQKSSYKTYNGFVVNMINSHTYVPPELKGKTCVEGCGSTISDPGSFLLQRLYSQKKIDVLTNEQKQDKTHVEFVGWIK